MRRTTQRYHTLDSATTKIIVHGNSYTAGLGASPLPASRWTNVAQALPALKGVPIDNRGVSAQTIRTLGHGTPSTMMQTGPSQVDAQLVAGKLNILVAWEGVNEYAQNGLDPDAVFDAYREYCLARRAAAAAAGKRLYIIVGDTTPGRSSTGTNPDSVTRNLGRARTNFLLRTGYQEFSDQYHPINDYEPFATLFRNGTFTVPEFQASGWWVRSDLGATDYSHFGNLGYAGLAQIWSYAFTRIRA